MSQEEDTQTAFNEKKDDNMRIQDDTHRAFGDPDEKDRKMGIKETHWAFGDPDEKARKMRIKDDPDVRDQFLQAFRDMVGEGMPRVPSGTDPPVSNPPALPDTYYVRRFIQHSAELDDAIVDLIVKEGGVTKLEFFKHITVEDLLEWGTPRAKARYLLLEAVPRMMKEIQELHDQDTSVPSHAMSMLHVDAPVVINSPAPVHANDEHLHFHANSLHSTATRDSTVNPPGTPPTIYC